MNLNPNWKPKKKWYQYSGITTQDAHAKRYKGRIDRGSNMLLYLFLLALVLAVFISYFSNR